MFDDIVAAYRKDRLHFIGSIVYVDQGEENKIYRYLVIDGQQRLTTIFLLLKAMYDLADDPNTKRELKDLCFNEDKYNDLKLTEQTKIKLKPIKMDNDQFLLLMNDDIESMNKASNIYNNYEYLKALLNKELVNGLRIQDVLAGLKMLTSAVIILDPKDDEPQVVFESINSTGLELSLADLIRNYILMTDKDQERLFERYWVKIEQNVGLKKMPAFIVDYLQLVCKEIVSNQNSYDLFKTYFTTNGYTNETMLQELLKYSKYYNAFLNGTNSKYGDNVNKKLIGLKTIDQSTIYSFLFRVFDDFDNQIIDLNTLEKVVTFFFNYLLRRIVCGVGSNSLRGLYKTLYNRIFVDKSYLDTYYESIVQFFSQLSTKDAIPSDSAFKDALMSSDIYNKKNVCKYILKSVENMTSDYKEGKEYINVEDLTIEHIMPQKLNADWDQELGPDFEKIHDRLMHNLGNLTLTGYNSELGQKSFAEKKQLIIDKNSHIVNLNEDVLDKEKWTEQNIVDRANRLSDDLLKIFAIDKFKNTIKFTSEDYRKVSLAEVVDLTYTKPKSCIFMGISIEVTSYADMLDKIFDYMYQLDDGIMDTLAEENFKLSETTRVYISKDPSLLRKASNIENTNIYYETNLNTNNIISFLKVLFDKYEIDYNELVIGLQNK